MKTQISIGAATFITEKIIEAIGWTCERIEIAGSIRRKKMSVGDIELIAIAKPNADLFGDPTGSQLADQLHKMVKDGRLQAIKTGGNKYKQFGIPGNPGLCLDLFIVTAETWGVQMAIRTGPREFSRRLVTNKSNPCGDGLLTDGLRVSGGHVYRGTPGQEGKPTAPLVESLERLSLGDERAFMALAGGWVEPADRR